MLECNATKNRVLCVVERLDIDGLCNQSNHLKVIFNSTFHYSEFGKILRPNEIEVSDFIKGKIGTYHCRVEDRLSYPLCHCYKYLDSIHSYLPAFFLFNCYHYYHGYLLNIGRSVLLNRIIILLNQSTVSFSRA